MIRTIPRGIRVRRSHLVCTYDRVRVIYVELEATRLEQSVEVDPRDRNALGRRSSFDGADRESRGQYQFYLVKEVSTKD